MRYVMTIPIFVPIGGGEGGDTQDGIPSLLVCILAVALAWVLTLCILEMLMVSRESISAFLFGSLSVACVFAAIHLHWAALVPAAVSLVGCGLSIAERCSD